MIPLGEELQVLQAKSRVTTVTGCLNFGEWAKRVKKRHLQTPLDFRLCGKVGKSKLAVLVPVPWLLGETGEFCSFNGLPSSQSVIIIKQAGTIFDAILIGSPVPPVLFYRLTTPVRPLTFRFPWANALSTQVPPTKTT